MTLIDEQDRFKQSLRCHRNGALTEAISGYREVLDRTPSHIDALYYLALASFQKNDHEACEASLKKILAITSTHAASHRLLGIVQQRLGRFEEALASFRRALEINPNFVDALGNLGDALQQQDRFDDALASYERALAINPFHAAAWNNRGTLLHKMERFDDALASYQRALAIAPNYTAALRNRGAVLDSLGRFHEALENYDRVLAIDPNDVDVLRGRANALRELKRFEEGIASCDAVLALRPDDVDTLNLRGGMLQEVERFEEALESFDRALAFEPRHIDFMANRSVVLNKAKRYKEALEGCDRALTVDPNHMGVLRIRIVALVDLRRFEEALESCERVLAIDPQNYDASIDRGNILRALKRNEEALASIERAMTIKPTDARLAFSRAWLLRDMGRTGEALAEFESAEALDPDDRHALNAVADLAAQACDWQRLDKLRGEVVSDVLEGKSIVHPFIFLKYSDNSAQQLQCSTQYMRESINKLPAPLHKVKPWRHRRPRIAYVAGTFASHATSILAAQLFERHDHRRFEIFGISTAPDDGSELRARIVKAFDQFHDIGSLDDLEAAQLLHKLQIDIAIDLMGHSGGARLGVFAHRPAPIQVSYLGYPATTGADFIDYIIADETVLPFDQQPHYTEQIAHLPECYQVNDSTRKITDRIPSRTELGLPEKAFVFCCFNNNYKITAPIFNIWMRLLAKVQGSVLWLLRDNAVAHSNLCREAVARNIDPARLVFADRAPNDVHLMRHKQADLFLDTLPVNAHTTASDALWAGLPVLTCLGHSFAGRVAASVLRAGGLPELVTKNLEEYEMLALKLASSPALLGRYRKRLEKNRLKEALFDTDRLCRHLEKAYLTMLDTHERGERPRGFSVKPLTTSVPAPRRAKRKRSNTRLKP